MSKAQELADKLDFHYADNGSGYNSEWTQGLQDAAALLRTQDTLLWQALEALDIAFSYQGDMFCKQHNDITDTYIAIQEHLK